VLHFDQSSRISFATMNQATRLPVKDHELTKLKNPLGMAVEPAILSGFKGKSSTQQKLHLEESTLDNECLP